jgi:hypothetical protein
MSLKFPISLTGKRSSADLCSYQGECEVLDPTRTYLFNANCGVIQSSDATSLPQNWGSNKGAYDIYIGSNLTTWGNSLFRSNPRLTSIYVPPTSTQCGIYAFYDSTDLHTVTFGGHYHAFGAYSFRYCNNLTRVNFCSPTPNGGVTGGTYGTFADCPNLTEIHVPENGWAGITTKYDRTIVRDLPPAEILPENTYAFDASSIVYRLATGNIVNNFARYFNPVSSIQIGTNATTIGSAAFRQHDCTEINIPSNITTIGNDAFFQGSQTNVALNFSEGLRTIGGSSFESTRWAGDIFLPTTLTSVGGRAFPKINGDSTVRNYYINSPASIFTGSAFLYHKVTDIIYVHSDYLSQYDATWETAQAPNGITIAEWTSYPDPMP